MPVALVVLALVAVACGSAPSAVRHPATVARVDAAGVTWLCRPGLAEDPCAGDLTTTVVGPGAKRHVERRRPVTRSAVACFYVYPTVSTEATGNANLVVQRAETAVAEAQAAPFSTVCPVYAPMYRQETLAALVGRSTTPPDAAEAYDDVRRAFTDFLRHDADGRGFVLIGHSQGAFVLERLIADVVAPDASLRRRLVSAVLLGGNVTVPDGRASGGTLGPVPVCRSASQVGCVIAYSSFAADHPPPADSLFGRTSAPGEQVVCTDPAALGGGVGHLTVELPTLAAAQGGVIGAGLAPLVRSVPAPWLTLVGRFTAGCEHADGASWLAVQPTTPAAARALDAVASVLPATWGTHLVDVTIAAGNLVADVGAEAAAYAAHGRR